MCAWGNRRWFLDWQLVKQPFLHAGKEQLNSIDPISNDLSPLYSMQFLSPRYTTLLRYLHL